MKDSERSMSQDLKQVRERWYEAFFAGDVECLAQIEANNFTVTTERGVQSKKSQIDSIHAAKRNGLWFPEGGRKQETELTVQGSEGSVIINGKGFTFSGRVKEQMVEFSETWERDGGSWRVSSLRYSDIRS